MAGEREYPVFNVLEMFEPSHYSTVIVSVNIDRDEDLDRPEELFSDTPHEFEDWTTNIRNICRQCSEGIPHDHHDRDLTDEQLSDKTLGVAAYEGQSVVNVFEVWQRESGGKLIAIDA